MALTLTKSTDTAPTNEFDYLHTPVWLHTVRLAVELDQMFPPERSDAMYEALAENDLSVFRYFLRHRRGC